MKQYIQATIEELNKRLMQELGPKQEEADRLKKHLDEIEREITAYIKALGKANLSLERLEAEVSHLEIERKEIAKKYEEVRREVNEQVVAEFNAELVKKNLKDFSKAFSGLAPRGPGRGTSMYPQGCLGFPR